MYAEQMQRYCIQNEESNVFVAASPLVSVVIEDHGDHHGNQVPPAHVTKLLFSTEGSDIYQHCGR